VLYINNSISLSCGSGLDRPSAAVAQVDVDIEAWGYLLDMTRPSIFIADIGQTPKKQNIFMKKMLYGLFKTKVTF